MEPMLPTMPLNPTTIPNRSALDAEQQQHLTRILDRFTRDAVAKYEAGQHEHGGNLWEKPGMLEHALQEAIDLVIYLYTALEQRDTKRTITGRD